MWILDVNESRGDILEWLQQEIKKQNGVRAHWLEKCWVWYLAFYFQQVRLCSVSLWFLHKEKTWSDILDAWNNSSTHIHTRMPSLWFYCYRRGFSTQSPWRAAAGTTHSDVSHSLQIKRNNISLEVQRSKNNGTISTNKIPTERKSLWVKKFQ